MIVAWGMMVACAARGWFVSGIAVAIVCHLFALLLVFVVFAVHTLMLIALLLPCLW